MGGFGSGRWRSHTKKTTAGQCRQIDIYTFNRELDLKPGTIANGTISWPPRWNEKSATISWQVKDEKLRLYYTVSRPSGKERDYDYSCKITWTKCNFGGKRPWLLCPNTNCGRRVAKIYKPPGKEVFLCRHCWDLTYQSCQDSHKYDRVYKSLAESFFR